MEPKAPLTGGEEAPTARSEFFTLFLNNVLAFWRQIWLTSRIMAATHHFSEFTSGGFYASDAALRALIAPITATTVAVSLALSLLRLPIGCRA